jgi:outer membrane protein TolC
LTAARAARTVATFQIQAARALPAPEFRMTFNNLSLDPDTADTRNSVAWRWSPPRPRELALKAQLARARRRTVDAEIWATEARITAAVRDAYRRASLSAERSDLARQTTELRRQMLDVTRRQVSTGLKEGVEADLAELALADAEVALQRMTALATAEKQRLARLLDPRGAVVSALAPVEAAPTTDRRLLVERALRSRPELVRAEGSCQEAASAKALAGNDRYPWISFAQVTRRLGADASSRGPWGLQFGVDLPLFRSAAQAEGRIATASVERCRLEEEALRARIRQEVEATAAQWDAAALELEKLERLIVGPSARAVLSTRAALAAGRADRVDLMTAEARQLSLRDRLLEKRWEMATLQAQLELATGL